MLTIASGALVLIATALAIAGTFGPKGIDRYEWPVMSLFSVTEFAPSYFFQNFAISVYFFIFLAFSLVTVAAFLVVLSKGVNEFLGLKNKQSKPILLFITLCLFAVSIIATQIHLKQTSYILLIVGSLYTFGYILLIWLGSCLRRGN